MDSVKDVTFGEVLEGLHRENSGSKSYAWAENRLKQADGLCIGRWALVILDKADIANIVYQRRPKFCGPSQISKAWWNAGKTSALTERETSHRVTFSSNL